KGRKKTLENNTRQTARRFSSWRRNQPILSRLRQRPASESGVAPAESATPSSNLNGCREANRDGGWRSRPITAPEAGQTGVPLLARVRLTLPPPRVIDRWNEKRALFGVYDNIGILGDFEKHPKELIKGPVWLRGWRGNELQRCIRKKKMVGNRMFTEDLHNLNKRISYLYKHFNRHGKYR
uniref:Large ribosomal subunit protein mL51 n=1 Tax=Rattus norvegicus TaxID=10116 RepID=A0ABK0LVP0_RAT